MRNVWALAAILTIAVTGACAQSSGSAPHWVGSWASSQQIVEPANMLPPPLSHDVTLRQVVHLSLGGHQLRVHLSNAFGTQPLLVTSVHIARPIMPWTGAIDAKSDEEVRFSGREAVTIPAGAEYVSEPIGFNAEPLSSLAITVHVDLFGPRQSGHPAPHATSYACTGNQVTAPSLSNATRLEHWYVISGVDVEGPAAASAIIALGDSITDGHGTTTDGNDRWTDDLAARLQAASGMHNVAVLNEGIGGNHLLTDGIGPNALARFDRDVLAPPAVRTVLLLEGVNDLGAIAITSVATTAQRDAMVQNILAAYQQLIVRAHEHGLKIVGATITPYVGSGYYHPSSDDEQARNQVNAWIRQPGHFDAVVDFDKATADPAHPERLLPAYDSGDHLHPSPAGYQAMAAAIPLSVLKH